MQSSAVLLYVTPDITLTGSHINAFEYFLTSFENNPNIKLIIFENGTKRNIDYLIKVMKNRYILNGLKGWEDNVIGMSRNELLRVHFDTVLILDFSTILKLKAFLAKKIIVISEKYTDEKRFFYDKNVYPVTYYGEMPFHYKDKQYRMKMMFNRFKPLSRVRPGVYINAPLSKNDDHLKNKHIPKNKPIIFKSAKHRENLFEWFDTYVYIHVERWFDPHPRLFHECYFYNKEIIYINPNQVKDGSWYRYNDLMERGLEDRLLTTEDEIVRQLI